MRLTFISETSYQRGTLSWCILNMMNFSESWSTAIGTETSPAYGKSNRCRTSQGVLLQPLWPWRPFPRKCKVRGKLIKFDAATLNSFLETSVVLELGEWCPIYSRYCHTYPDHQAIAAKLWLPGRGFVLNAEGGPLEASEEGLGHLSLDLECPFLLQPCSHLSHLWS